MKWQTWVPRASEFPPICLLINSKSHILSFATCEMRCFESLIWMLQFSVHQQNTISLQKYRTTTTTTTERRVHLPILAYIKTHSKYCIAFEFSHHHRVLHKSITICTVFESLWHDLILKRPYKIYSLRAPFSPPL